MQLPVAAWISLFKMRFIIVGSGAVFDLARRRAVELGISSRILFTGHSRNVGYWLSKMNLVMLLSEFEGLPNVLMEAQLAGLPVLSTPAGGSTETFISGRTGLALQSASNPTTADFLAKLDELISDPVRLRFMGSQARENAKQKFAIPKILALTTRLFKARTNDFGREGIELSGPATKTA